MKLLLTFIVSLFVGAMLALALWLVLLIAMRPQLHKDSWHPPSYQIDLSRE